MIKGYNSVQRGLEQEIIYKINKLERKRLVFKQGVYELISLISFIGIIPAVIYIVNSFSNSGAYEYMTLVFSDIETLIYWKELMFSILESMPFLALALGLGILAIFLWSIFRTVRLQLLKNSIVFQ